MEVLISFFMTTRESGCRCPVPPLYMRKALEGVSAVTGTPWSVWPGRGFTKGSRTLLLEAHAPRIHLGVALAEAATRQLSRCVALQRLGRTLRLATSTRPTVGSAVASRWASVEFVTPTCCGSKAWTALRRRSTTPLWLVRKDLSSFFVIVLPRFSTATFSWINNVCLFIGDNIVEELDSGDEEEAGASAEATSSLPTPRGWTASPPCLTVPYYPNIDDYFHRGVPPRLRSQSPRVRTAPPSPLRPHRVMNLPPVPPVELAKQESLDELRTTVQLAASSMENSTKDIKLLGEKMAAATERMSDTVQDNSQALVLLTQVVDRLQMLLAATRTDINIPNPAATEQDSTPKKNSREQRPSLTHQARCSFPSLPSSTSSSSFTSSLDAPSTSQGTSCLPVSCHGSPQTTLKTKNAPVSQKKHIQAELQASKHPLTNGKLDEPKETSRSVRGNRSGQQKKRRKKATWEMPKCPKSEPLGSYQPQW